MRPSPSTIRALIGLLVVAVVSACAIESFPSVPPEPDRTEFEQQVYPVLVRDCGFPACHGSADRFFRVHGPGRSRLSPSTALNAAVTAEELEAAYERARSMLAQAPTPRDSLLLRKPLELDEGGAPHMGVDGFGRDVYGTHEAPGYQTMLEWADGATGQETLEVVEGAE